MMVYDSHQARARLEALATLEARLSFRISRLSKLLDTQASRLLAGTDLNLTSHRILMVVDIFSEISAADLSRLMVIDRAQVSRSVAELIRQDMLADRADPTNKRRKLLSLTEKGAEQLEALRPAFDARQERIDTLLDPDDKEGLVNAIDTLSRFLAQEINYPEAIPYS